MSWIVHQSDPLGVREGVTGGKGSSLARLSQLGARVPRFFVVPADAHRAMRDGILTDEFITQLREALATLNLADGVAVRSSAIGEDSADSSFAGLYHTSLQVKTFDGVVEALKTCWASYSNVVAIDYRAGRSADRDNGAMAVVVQEMIVGEWSGVSFTANPISLALSEGVINAVEGLGEALVSGEVNPDEITIRMDDGAVINRRSGSVKRPLPAEAIVEIWAQSKKIADQIGFPLIIPVESG